MAIATINEQRIFFTDTGGPGPVVVFSHGFSMDHSTFDTQITALAPAYRVITWDQRGFGATEFDEKPFTYWDSAGDCLGLLDHLGIPAAVLGGMSQGGFLSLRAALLAPERVRALVLIDTAADAETPANVELYRDMLEAWVTVGPGEGLAAIVARIIVDDPEHDRVWIARWQGAPRELLREPGRCLLEREDISDRLGEITCPALVIHGSNDSAIDLDRACALSAALVGAGGVVVVDGAAHAANLTHPEPVNAALLRFLGSLGR
jgi:pimeloyl-ACP methyl ester carboxylesterase